MEKNLVKYSGNGKELIRCDRSFQGHLAIPEGVTINE